MRVLCQWYEQAVGRALPNTQSGTCLTGLSCDGHVMVSTGTTSRPPVIIMLQDFEAFEAQIVQELILSLRFAIRLIINSNSILKLIILYSKNSKVSVNITKSST